jgi:hypothetical protein
MNKVIKIENDELLFSDGSRLYSEHKQDCCETHYLDFTHLTLKDFEGLEFNLDGDEFFRRIAGYGIELMPIHGWSVKIPGYGSNNGYYSDNLDLVLARPRQEPIIFGITDCQTVNG